MTRSNGIGMEIGLLAGLLFLNVLFQFMPATEIGRLSTRTFDNSMEAVEAFLPFDATVEDKQEDLIDDIAEIEVEVENVRDEVLTELVITLSADTVGLSTALTATAGSGNNNTGSSDIGAPTFQPVEVFPVCSFMPSPAYPEMARMAGVEGAVTLWVYVDAQGIVKEVELMQSSGVSSLDEAALAAARGTGWMPARNNGSPVGVWTTLRYNFSLSD